jgi:hypothetical protein
MACARCSCVVEATGRTYQAHKAAGLKISSRDQVISLFLKDRIYYKELKNLKHTPVEMTRPLVCCVSDFGFGASAYKDTPQRGVFVCRPLCIRLFL